MMVDAFISAAMTGLFGDPLIEFQPGAQLELPDGLRAKVTSLISIESPAVWSAASERAREPYHQLEGQGDR
jgi:hypothetical protein